MIMVRMGMDDSISDRAPDFKGRLTFRKKQRRPPVQATVLLVEVAGIEPARKKISWDFKSHVSTNSTTPAETYNIPKF